MGFLLLVDFFFLFISFSFFSSFCTFISSEKLVSHKDGQPLAGLFIEDASKSV